MPKRHLVRVETDTVPLCGRPTQAYNRTTATSRVTCANCAATPFFAAEETRQKVAAQTARLQYLATQVPHKVPNPFGREPITCRACGYDEFRYDGRSLDTNNYLCAACGATNHTMTETGMSA